MEFRLFAYPLGASREFNPYLRLGRFELCIDRDGFRLWLGAHNWGWSRGVGFWISR